MDNDPREDDAASRQAESAEIQREYATYLAPRNGQTDHKWSPEYRNSQPKSMIEALGVTVAEEEEILYHYAVTASIPKTAALASVGQDKVRAVIFNPPTSERIRLMREQMRVSIIEEIEKAQIDLIDGIRDPHKIAGAPLRELSSVLSEVSAVQISLANSAREAAGPSPMNFDPEKVFTGDELEHMAYLRRKLNIAPPSGSSGGQGDPMSGHEFIDPQYTQLDPGYEPLPELKTTDYDPFAEQNDSEGEEYEIEDNKTEE